MGAKTVYFFPRAGKESILFAGEDERDPRRAEGRKEGGERTPDSTARRGSVTPEKVDLTRGKTKDRSTKNTSKVPPKKESHVL